MLKVDLHLHTSEDPVDIITHSARQLIDRAAELGFDALALTLHDCDFRDPGLRSYAVIEESCWSRVLNERSMDGTSC